MSQRRRCGSWGCTAPEHRWAGRAREACDGSVKPVGSDVTSCHQGLRGKSRECANKSVRKPAGVVVTYVADRDSRPLTDYSSADRKGRVMAVMDYQTSDGLANYGFSIEFHPGLGWRIYIIFDPVRKGQTDILQFPYESLDNNGRRYVDWPKLDSLGDAKTVAELWAELVHHHQRTQGEHHLHVGSTGHCSSAQTKK